MVHSSNVIARGFPAAQVVWKSRTLVPVFRIVPVALAATYRLHIAPLCTLSTFFPHLMHDSAHLKGHFPLPFVDMRVVRSNEIVTTALPSLWHAQVLGDLTYRVMYLIERKLEWYMLQCILNC